MKVVMSCDEWYPYHDIDVLKPCEAVSVYDRVVDISDEDYVVYKGLLTQMERLQNKLGLLWKQAPCLEKDAKW